MTRYRFLIFPSAFALFLFVTYLPLPARAQSVAANAASSPIAKGKSTAKSSKTETSALPGDVADTEVMDAHDPRFGIPPMPKGKVSLIGGTVQKVDPIRQLLSIKVFGNNKKLTFRYDERSHLYRNGVPITSKGLQKGERIYVDSMLDRDNKLLARNVRVVTSLQAADARGQIMQYRPKSGVLVIQDELSQAPVYLHVSKDTKVTGSGNSPVDFVPGALVAVHFGSNYRNRDIATEVHILAEPGAMFTFVGSVTYLDMKDRVLAVHNQSDDKTYELHFDPGTVSDNVTVGSDVDISAEFVGNAYKARTVKVNPSSPANSQTSSM